MIGYDRDEGLAGLLWLRVGNGYWIMGHCFLANWLGGIVHFFWVWGLLLGLFGVNAIIFGMRFGGIDGVIWDCTF
jgi:hypothetical protein